MIKLFIKIRELGVNPNLSISLSKKIRSTNVLGIIPMFMYLVYLIFGLVNQYYFPVIVCSILIFLSLLGLYLNAKGNYLIAKNILFCINTFAIFITYNSLNIDYTICCYFFPLIMAYEILFDYKEKLKIFSASLIILIAVFAAIFLLPKGIFYYFEMDEKLLSTSKFLNVLLPFAISIFFLYLIMGMHHLANKQLEHAKNSAENASKAKSFFLSNMSHELRTPLNGIIGATNLLANENITQSQKRYFNIIKYSGEHMVSLVNDILDFSKTQSGKLELDNNVFNLEHVVDNVVQMFETISTNKSLDFIILKDENINTNVESDDLRLSQILQNLLSNAFKFTQQGAVTFETNVLENTSTKVLVKFTITDTGIGIKDEHQQKIFESFIQADGSTSRQFGGTGLGLSITKDLIKKFDSEIELKSTYGRGTQFAFTIHFKKSALTEDSVLSEPINEELCFIKQPKVLLAEDNKINMIVARNFLKKWNLQVEEATNGYKAIELFKMHSFDLVLLDLEMPEMDGHTAIKIIREINKVVPIIAFTAAAYENMGNKLEKAGFNGYIGKPFKPQELAELIKKHIN